MSAVRVIKRYANRKLYDTSQSRYITLDEIGQMIKAGDDIQIIDNKTKEDLTAVTMAQILVEEEKREKRAALPSLRGLIQRRIAEPVSNIRTSVEEQVNKLIRSGEEKAEVTREQIRGWIDQNTMALEELQRRVDERVKLTIASLDPLGKLGGQIDELSARLAVVESKLGIEPPKPAESTESVATEPTKSPDPG